VVVIDETAQQLGKLIGQGEEYRALLRARDAVEEDKGLREKLRRLEELAGTVQQKVAQGQEPEPAEAEEYERLFGEVQSSPSYQQLVAAQSNFDKVMHHVQEQIMEGMRKGGQSRIITLT
jgi:cell fate (sporulation/competence/biofilm development) regulator YlbF (YheA/YmcA/DUF963 family)